MLKSILLCCEKYANWEQAKSIFVGGLTETENLSTDPFVLFIVLLLDNVIYYIVTYLYPPHALKYSDPAYVDDPQRTIGVLHSVTEYNIRPLK